MFTLHKRKVNIEIVYEASFKISMFNNHIDQPIMKKDNQGQNRLC